MTTKQKMEDYRKAIRPILEMHKEEVINQRKQMDRLTAPYYDPLTNDHSRLLKMKPEELLKLAVVAVMLRDAERGISWGERALAVCDEMEGGAK